MENRNNIIFTFLNRTFVLFALDVLILMIFAHFVGDDAKTLSTLYQLGSKGLASSTMLQFLLSAATVSVLQLFLYSERIFKKRMALWRAAFLLLGILITHIIYILGFGWFSFQEYYAWLAFIICLIIGFILGLLFMVIKTKVENRQYNRLLARYKEQHERENEDE